MSGGGLGLALAGVGAWVLVLASTGSRRSLYRSGVQGLAAHTVVSTLVAVALVSTGVFRVDTTQALASLVPLTILLKSRHRSWEELRDAPYITRFELITVLLVVLVSPVALPRMSPLLMEYDAAVYSNRAIHHLSQGTTAGTIPVRDRLEGAVLETFDRDNVYRRDLYRPGAYRLPPGSGRYVFQFFPAWPMLMAQWEGLFGLPRMFDAGLFAFVMAAILFGFLLEGAGTGTGAFSLTVALFVTSPLLLYFSKYTTSEAFFLFLFLFVLHFLVEDDMSHTALAGAGVLAIVATHVSTFAYAPLVLLVSLEAYRSRSRKLALFSVCAFGALLAGLPLGDVFSPVYVRGIRRAVFGALPVGDPAGVGLLLIGISYTVGLLVSLAALRRAWRTAAPAPWILESASGGSKALRWTIRVVLLLLLAGAAGRAYQLGWTDQLLGQEIGGAWGARTDYAGQGWSSLAHLNIVNMTMATSLVGLPVVLGLLWWRGDRVCTRADRCFLLAALLLSLAIHGALRIDTPTNYYASRYFIPIFVPVTMLLFGQLLGLVALRRPWVVTAALLGLAFTLPFDLVLYKHPTHMEELRFVEDVASRVGDNRILFARNLWRKNRMIRRLLSIPLQDLHGISLICVVGRQGGAADESILAYARALRLRDAAVLSLDPPTDGRSFEAVHLRQRRLAPARFYPLSSRESHDTFYLYNVPFE